MATKDYYRILQVSPAATTQEIKKAFRALALRFHPDKNAGDPLAAIHFREIQEAYTILSDKAKRTAWHYEHYHLLNKAARTGTVSPGWILTQCQQIHKTSSRQNPFLLNQDMLFLQIRELLSSYHLSVLQHSGDITANSAIVQQILDCIVLLPFSQSQQIAGILLEIQPVQASATIAIHTAVKEMKRQWLIEKYKMPAAILLALALLAIMIVSLR
jgi:hypothetical protein